MAHARRRTTIAARVLAVTSVVALCAAGAAGWITWSSRTSVERASSTRVAAPEFQRAFGDSGPEGLVQPVGIAVAGGRVYVADAAKSVLAVFTTSGRRATTIGAGRLTTPAYVALNPLDGRLYVSDRRANVVQIFGVDGRFIRTFQPVGQAGAAAIRGWQPLALAFGEDGTLYATDVGARQRVVAFGPAGEYVAETGADIPIGPSGRSLSFANGLAVLGERLIVADSNNSRVVVLDAGLKFRRATSFPGLPRGVAALTDGLCVVVDTTGASLRIIGADAATLAQSASTGGSGESLALPTAVAADGAGRVYVTDTGNHRIAVWGVAGMVRRDLVLEALADVRWWLVAALAMLGMVSGVAALLVGRNGPRTIQ